MNQIGVEGHFLETIGSYLAGRKQVVVVDGVRSEPLDIKAGVPQGRVKYCWVFFDKIETMNIFKNTQNCFSYISATKYCRDTVLY